MWLKRNKRVHEIGTSDGTSGTTGATNNTGAEICTVNIDDFQYLIFQVKIKKDNRILKGYGAGTIKNIGLTDLKVTFRNKSINTKFNLVYAPGKPSVIGYAEAQEVGIMTLNIDEIKSNDNQAKQAADKVS